MTKILITYSQPILNNNPNNLVCYYEGLIKELNKYGNDVFRVNLMYRYNKRQLVNSIEQFSPDLIFTFNNQMLEEFIQVTNCPIVVFDADAVDLFVNIDFIKKYQDRYYMVTHYEGWQDRYYEVGFTKNKICCIHQATAVQSEQLEKNTNISFIGSNFNFANNDLTAFLKGSDNRSIYEALKYFWKNNDYDYKSVVEMFCKDKEFGLFGLHCIFDSRIYILSSILDLGLNLYGVGWERLAKTNYALASAYIKEPKYSLKHNQDIYNSSKINISISHPQTNGFAFPWRIYDIMASSGMLISSRADLLKKQTKGFVEIPMYDSPYEARDLCKKYLKEDALREDIIAASNEFIEKHGRWESNFKTLEEFLNIKLVNKDSNRIGKDDFIHVDIKLINKSFDKTKKRKNITNGIFLILSNLPFLERAFSKKNKIKLYNSIEKNKIL